MGNIFCSTTPCSLMIRPHENISLFILNLNSREQLIDICWSCLIYFLQSVPTVPTDPSKRVRDRISSNVYFCIRCCSRRSPGRRRVVPGAASGERNWRESAESDYDFHVRPGWWWPCLSPGQGPVCGCRGSDDVTRVSGWPWDGADGLLTSGPRASGLHHIPPWPAASSNCFFRAWKERGVLECVLFLWQVWGNSDYCQSRQIKDGKFWHCVNIYWQNSQSVKHCADNVDKMTMMNMETAEKIKLRATRSFHHQASLALQSVPGCGHKNSGQQYFPCGNQEDTLSPSFISNWNE